MEALEASQITGVNKNTTQGIYSMIRRRVVGIEAVLSAGCGGVNESYFGSRKVRRIQGRGAVKKIPVICFLKKGRRVARLLPPFYLNLVQRSCMVAAH